MTMTTYGVCPRCGSVTSKKETTGTAGTTQSERYVKGPKCKHRCKGRTAKQAPEVRREKD